MLQKKFTAQPLYVQLREALTRRIATGEWPPGEAIPNEIAIGREFGLSAGTVRKALDWMEQARLVSRQQGRGTFVIDQSSDELANRFENLRQLDGSPLLAEAKAKEVQERTASLEEAERLQLSRGEMVFELSQTRCSADGRPVAVDTVILPATLFTRDAVREGADHSILRLAKRAGVLLGTGEERVSLAQVDPATAKLLRTDAGTSVVRLDRIVNTIDGTPAEWRVAYCTMSGSAYVSQLRA